MSEPYVLKPRNFREMSPSEGFDVNIMVEGDDGQRMPWIECGGLSLSDGYGYIWNTTDIRYGADHVKSFHIPVIGFKFDHMSSGAIWMNAWVKPRLHFERIGLLPEGFELDPKKNAKTYDGRLDADPSLTRFLLGRKLLIVISAQRPKGKR